MYCKKVSYDCMINFGGPFFRLRWILLHRGIDKFGGVLVFKIFICTTTLSANVMVAKRSTNWVSYEVVTVSAYQ